MSKQCRLCAKFTESAIDLFLEHENTLLTNINHFLPINISKVKELPSKICCKCVDRSNATHLFIQEVLLAQEVFGISTNTSAHMAGATNSVMYGGITISSMNQTTINVPSSTNKRKKVQNVSETLRKLKKMQTGNLTISKRIVQGPKPIRKCKKEPKTYKEEGEDSEVEFDRCDDEDNDPNFDGGRAHEVSESDDNYDNDDDDDDYKPLSSWVKSNKKAKLSKPATNMNDSNQKLPQFDAKTADTSPKFKALKINAPPVFLCMKCKNRFDSLIALKQHVFQKNSCSVTQLTCNVCNKTFENKKRMSQHMKSHEEKVKFICDKCGKMYHQQFNLENHKSAQHGEYLDEHQNVYKCRLCSAKFDNRTDLYTHMKNHANDNQELLCDTCGKCFKNNHNLKNHMRTHLNLRPHECTFCPKKFRTRLLLKQHLHVHTGIKEFQCSVCAALFAKRDSLRSHMRKQHPDYQPNKTNDAIKESEVPVNIIEKPPNGDSMPIDSATIDQVPNHSAPMNSEPTDSMPISSLQSILGNQLLESKN
ncbi:zinc finger protein PLAG1-like [Sitodiplosis mosellana]|uniref:zinc finger protein PLAG1-like n=1 Tax=Sitodiplosis mosellana TaxID=263140 RepID=UPI00244392F4|nr:zinc finger protein PLAG1-like [Sitodiplosis mosellana]